MEVSWNMGTPWYHPFIDGFSFVNHPAIGHPHLLEPPICTLRRQWRKTQDGIDALLAKSPLAHQMPGTGPWGLQQQPEPSTASTVDLHIALGYSGWIWAISGDLRYFWMAHLDPAAKHQRLLPHAVRRCYHLLWRWLHFKSRLHCLGSGTSAWHFITFHHISHLSVSLYVSRMCLWRHKLSVTACYVMLCHVMPWLPSQSQAVVISTVTGQVMLAKCSHALCRFTAEKRRKV